MSSDEITAVAPIAAAPAAVAAAAAAAAAAPAAPAAPAPLDLRSALAQVLKSALVHDQLARGLHECAKALDRGKATFCVLAADCEEEPYIRLVEALCAARGIPLIKVPEAKQLGEWAGLCKIDKEGKPRKIVCCSSVVVREIRIGGPAVEFLVGHFKGLGGSALEVPAAPPAPAAAAAPPADAKPADAKASSAKATKAPK